MSSISSGVRSQANRCRHASMRIIHTTLDN
jgi:hypothetical protein